MTILAEIEPDVAVPVLDDDPRLTDARDPTAHGHDAADITDLPVSSGREVGEVTMWPAALAAIPTGWLLCDGSVKQMADHPALGALLGNTYGGNGTSTFAVPNFLAAFPRGIATAATEPGATGGSATHGHDAHVVTQPSAHTVMQPNNHVVTQPSAHANHTHTYTQVVNHVHVQTVNSATTGGLSGYTPDTSSNTPAVSGYSTQNPTGGVAQGTTNNESASLTHAGTAVDAHAGTAVSAHAGTAVDAHSSSSNLPPFVGVAFLIKT